MSAAPLSATSSSATPLFIAAGVGKRYGAVQALDEVSLSLEAGEVHALIGENGAGKSTLIRIATGLTSPDTGELRLAGRPYRPDSPSAAAAAGVRLVGQDFALAPNLTVAENLCLGSPQFLAGCPRLGPARRFPWRRALAWAGEQLTAAGVRVDPRRRVDGLSVSERQLVALVRGLLDGPRVVFLDEPSSALDTDGVAVLSAVVRRLRADGVAVVYVSHKLEEVFALADRLTVLRDGRTVAAGVPVAGSTPREVITTMVGREVGRLFPTRLDKPGKVVLELRGLTAPRVHGVDLTVRQGEILGIGGLIGAGRTELARAIAGLTPVTGGQLLLDGAPVRWRSRRHALRRGVEYVTEDRLGEGLVPLRSVDENVTARVLHRFTRGPFLRRSGTAEFTRTRIERFRIAVRGPDTPVGTLSGGNQQKVLLAACLASDPRVVVFDEPTRGIDVGAKAEIYTIVRELARDRAVVVISAELVELLGLTDRILIMRDGRVAAEFPAVGATEQTLIEAALGGADPADGSPAGS